MGYCRTGVKGGRGNAKQTTTIAYEKSSGNVFADLGLPHPEQELLKARLTLQIYRIIKARQLTQAQAARQAGAPDLTIQLDLSHPPAARSSGEMLSPR